MRQAANAVPLALLLLALAAQAGEPHVHDHERPPPPPGQPRMIEHSHPRAGFPLCVSPHAAPTRTPAYRGYYVGGGAGRHGDPRCLNEGTWGRDYVGLHLPRNVVLRWSHGRLYQGGTGSYTTEGPPTPDPISQTTTRLRLHGSEEAPEH